MSPDGLRLSKLHGAGNDFLVTVGTADRGPDAAVAAGLCDRHRGIGADGLVTLLPGRDGADCTMQLRNADGSLAEMSGNGIGCLSWVAVREGIGDGTRLVVDTGGGRRDVELDVDRATGELVGATVDMGPVTFEPAEIPLDAPSALDLEVTFHGVTYHGDAAGMGNPHLVLLVDDPATTRVIQHGPHLETDDRFPHRTNVEFAAVTAPDELSMRVWER
ncbi:MAG TPA: diaminopimelate epimerase, partial [Acidimicrobiia bacterium]